MWNEASKGSSNKTRVADTTPSIDFSDQSLHVMIDHISDPSASHNIPQSFTRHSPSPHVRPDNDGRHSSSQNSESHEASVWTMNLSALMDLLRSYTQGTMSPEIEMAVRQVILLVIGFPAESMVAFIQSGITSEKCNVSGALFITVISQHPFSSFARKSCIMWWI